VRPDENGRTVKHLRDGILSADRRLAMPILAFPGAALIGCSVRELVTDSAAQVAAQHALHKRLATTFLLSAMDLSVEPEEFGAEIRFADTEVPTVTGRLVCDEENVARLAVPVVGARRSRVYVETIRRLAADAGGQPVLAGMMGPFTLASRLYGISETLVDSIERPELIHALLAKAHAFLVAYARAFKTAGADGVIVAEPMAGLISPQAVREFSSAYLRCLVAEVEDENFEVIVHNCGARLAHLPAILESGARIYHFGQPMDMAAALAEVPPGVVVCGNLDPSGVFVRLTPAAVRDSTLALLRAVARESRKFVISSGCDLPPDTPLANIEAFFRTVRDQSRAT
jgi:uroporphyrinogen decarboxylase